MPVTVSLNSLKYTPKNGPTHPSAIFNFNIQGTPLGMQLSIGENKSINIVVSNREAKNVEEAATIALGLIKQFANELANAADNATKLKLNG